LNETRINGNKKAEIILNYLKEKKQITNREARKITGEEDKVKIKNVRNSDKSELPKFFILHS